MTDYPLVTVGIPLYNHENFIEQCLKSIISQTYPNIEIILIDDGSSDDSYSIAESLLSSQDEYQAIYKTRSNRGMCNTLNEIIDLSSGKYISFIGSDDYWHYEKIEKQTDYLENHPDVALVHSNSYVVDENNNVTGERDLTNKINSGKIHSQFIHNTASINTTSHLYRLSVFDVIEKYDPNFLFEDVDMWLRITKHFSIGFIDEHLSYYRRHSNNLSHDDNALAFYNEELIKIYKKNIDDPDELKVVIKRMYRKSYLRALRKGRFHIFFKYLYKYWAKINISNK